MTPNSGGDLYAPLGPCVYRETEDSALDDSWKDETEDIHSPPLLLFFTVLFRTFFLSFPRHTGFSILSLHQPYAFNHRNSKNVSKGSFTPLAKAWERIGRRSYSPVFLLFTCCRDCQTFAHHWESVLLLIRYIDLKHAASKNMDCIMLSSCLPLSTVPDLFPCFKFNGILVNPINFLPSRGTRLLCTWNIKNAGTRTFSAELSPQGLVKQMMRTSCSQMWKEFYKKACFCFERRISSVRTSLRCDCSHACVTWSGETASASVLMYDLLHSRTL